MAVSLKIDIFASAPHDLARQMMVSCIDFDNEDTLDTVFLATNNAMQLRTLGGDSDLPVCDDEFAMMFVNAMDDDQLQQTWEYLKELARNIYN